MHRTGRRTEDAGRKLPKLAVVRIRAPSCRHAAVSDPTVCRCT